MGGAAFIGRVVSNRMQKTVVVAVSYLAYRPKLKLYEKRTAKHFAHAEATTPTSTSGTSCASSGRSA